MTKPEIIMQPGALPVRGTGPRHQIRDRYADELAKVAADPGQWYHLLRYPASSPNSTVGATASRLRRALPDYEVASRKRSVWVRYVGHGEEAED